MEIDSTFLRGIHDRLSKSMSGVESLAGALSAEQLNWKPSAAGWSVGQCLDHLSVGAEEYVAKLAPAVERARSAGANAAADLAHRPTFIGRLIIRAVEPSAARPMKAPKIFQPSQSAVSADVVARFISCHERVSELAAACDGIDFNRVRLSSPVAAFLRLSAADAFQLLSSHAERHLGQAERVVKAEGFPS